MQKIINFVIYNKLIFSVILLALVLRFVNLGYSDFQGDEIKALFILDNNQSIVQFLLDQRKGPVQFLITYFLKLIDPNYENQFLIRLPFAFAGTLSIVFFYYLIKNIFNQKIAFYASLFFALNGLLIAFSRIVQYQSFVILFMIVSLYYLHKKNIYLGLFFWALSIMSHYDGIFIFPIGIYLIYVYLTDCKKDNKNVIFFLKKIKINKKNLTNFLISGAISTIFLALFYVPFILNISTSTQEYWLGRITGLSSTKISSSEYLFSVYQPIYIVHIYYALTLIGIFYALLKFRRKINIKINFLKKLLPNFLKKIIDDIKIESEFTKIVVLILWILFPLLFLEIFVYIPGTHIYVYVIPTTILMALGLHMIEKIFNFNNFTSYIFIVISIIVFSFIFFQSYYIFVDNKFEYPYEEEKFLIWTFPKPNPVFHLSIFGFPYFRNWESISTFIKNYPKTATHYSTNERESISRYYIDLKKDTSDAGFYVHIRNPQSFEDNITNDKALYWSQNYEPIYTYSKSNKELVNIYFMDVGELEQIKKKPLNKWV